MDRLFENCRVLRRGMEKGVYSIDCNGLTDEYELQYVEFKTKDRQIAKKIKTGFQPINYTGSFSTNGSSICKERVVLSIVSASKISFFENAPSSLNFLAETRTLPSKDPTVLL